MSIHKIDQRIEENPVGIKWPDTFLEAANWKYRLITNSNGSNAVGDIDNLTERNGKLVLADNKKHDLDGNISLPWAQKRAFFTLNAALNLDSEFALIATSSYKTRDPTDPIYVTTIREILEKQIYEPTIFNMHETTRYEYNLVANQYLNGETKSLVEGFQN